jgi:hypothetical protein
MLNAREEFNITLALFRNQHFLDHFRSARPPVAIRLSYGQWTGRRNLVLTQLLREATVGLESSVSSAVFALGLSLGKLDQAMVDATRNPTKLSPSVAGSVYNGLPKLIDPGFMLTRRNAPLWKQIHAYYEEIRNPLFHGYELESDDPGPVLACLEMIWAVYQWINSWCPPDVLLEGPVLWSPAYKARIVDIPKITDDQVASMFPQFATPPGGHIDFAIEDVDGMYIAPDPEVQLTVRVPGGEQKNVLLTSVAAMRLLGAMAIVHQQRGWPIPEPVFG